MLQWRKWTSKDFKKQRIIMKVVNIPELIVLNSCDILMLHFILSDFKNIIWPQHALRMTMVLNIRRWQFQSRKIYNTFSTIPRVILQNMSDISCLHQSLPTQVDNNLDYLLMTSPTTFALWLGSPIYLFGKIFFQGKLLIYF